MKSSILLIFIFFSFVSFTGCLPEETTEDLNLVEGSAANYKINLDVENIDVTDLKKCTPALDSVLGYDSESGVFKYCDRTKWEIIFDGNFSTEEIVSNFIANDNLLKEVVVVEYNSVSNIFELSSKWKAHPCNSSMANVIGYMHITKQLYLCTNDSWSHLRNPNDSDVISDPVITPEPVVTSEPDVTTALLWKFSNTSTQNAPNRRHEHTLIWTGIEMIVFGGMGSGVVGNGGRLSAGCKYNPAVDLWSELADVNAPVPRNEHTAVWTGDHMIIWGGSTGDSQIHGKTNTGAIYFPDGDSWDEVSTVNAPSARSLHGAVWTGSEMVIWGGWNGTTLLNDGKIYEPLTNTWREMSSENQPEARANFSIVWTGSKVVVWGGTCVSGGDYCTSAGGIYDLQSDSWAKISIENAPTGIVTGGGSMNSQTTAWTGDRMLIFGGGTNRLWEFDPESNIWTELKSAPEERIMNAGAWTGTELVISGDMSHTSVMVYNLLTDSWRSVGYDLQPTFFLSPAVWTGDSFIRWGGYSYSAGATNSGYIIRLE